MRLTVKLAPVAALLAAGILSSCSDEPKNVPPVRTVPMGERVTLGHITYTVFETQWMTKLGTGADEHVPQNRYLLLRLSAANGGNSEVMIPNLTLEDDNGNSYAEIGGEAAQQAPHYVGYLRRVKPAEAAQGNAVFDVPPRHYKLKVRDEENDLTAYVDIPLSFTSDSPDVPPIGEQKNEQPKVMSPGRK